MTSLGLHRTPGGLEIEVVRAGRVQFVKRHGPVRCTVDADDVLDLRATGPDPVDVLLLADHHLGAGVGEHVRQLFWCQRVVDRERGGADVLSAHFQWVELDPVGHHQRNRVATPDPQPGQAGGHSAHIGRVLPPGHRLAATRCAQRDSVRIDRRGPLEGLTQGRRLFGGGFRIAHATEASPGSTLPV